jgi:hypothetical protein
LILQAQTNPVDDLFEKYSGKDGFTTIYISSKMFSMFGSLDLEDEDLNNLMNRLKTIRILTVEDTTLNKKIDFYNEISKKLNFEDYEELMVVKESEKTTKFLVKQSGKTISELLVISGGKGSNALISIRGDIDLKNISNISKKMGFKQLESLEKIDQKYPKK